MVILTSTALGAVGDQTQTQKMTKHRVKPAPHDVFIAKIQKKVSVLRKNDYICNHFNTVDYEESIDIFSDGTDGEPRFDGYRL
jgi:hypothetical protein